LVTARCIHFFHQWIEASRRLVEDADWLLGGTLSKGARSRRSAVRSRLLQTPAEHRMRADGKILKKIAIFCVLTFGATSKAGA
jgi:hypothetical protein